MEILEQTPARLSLRDRGLMFWLSFGAMAIAGLGMMPLGKQTVFSCQRASVLSAQCTLQETSFLVSTRRPVPLHTIREVRVVRRSRSRGSTTYSVVMQMTGRRVTLSSGSSHQSRQEAIAAQLNSFLMDNTQSSVRIENDERMLTLFIGGFLGAIGLAGLFGICEINLCVFDKRNHTLRHIRRGAIGQKQTVLPLQQIQFASVERGKGKQRSSGRIVLCLESGSLPLTRNLYPGLPQKEHVAELISDFVATPLTELAAPPRRAQPTPVPSDPEAAIALYRQTLESTPDDPDLHYRLGMALYKQCDVQAAATHLQRARELFEAAHQHSRVIQVQDMLWRLERD